MSAIKTIPQIPVETSISPNDKFIVRISGNTNPNEVIWTTMLTQALSAIPASYYISH